MWLSMLGLAACWNHTWQLKTAVGDAPGTMAVHGAFHGCQVAILQA